MQVMVGVRYVELEMEKVRQRGLEAAAAGYGVSAPAAAAVMERQGRKRGVEEDVRCAELCCSTHGESVGEQLCLTPADCGLGRGLPHRGCKTPRPGFTSRCTSSSTFTALPRSRRTPSSSKPAIGRRRNPERAKCWSWCGDDVEALALLVAHGRRGPEPEEREEYVAR